MGAAKLDHVLNWCTALGIPAVTLWVCSTKNLQRSAQEVSGILAAIQDKLADLATDPLVHQRQVRVRAAGRLNLLPRSEEHTSELQSLMRISYAVFCLKKKKNPHTTHSHSII